ncbi:MAG TPA: hypothetical protein VGI47_05235 [Candidatus Binataceae bacterium]|jgi:hypothetical protein
MTQRKVNLKLIFAAWLISAAVFSGAGALGDEAKLPAGLPDVWNKKIPLPPGATVVTVGKTQGAIANVELVTPGDFNGLIDFFQTGLTKAGFKLDTPLKMTARKSYNVSFEGRGTLNSLTIYPSDKDPSKFTIRITYVPVTKGPDSAAAAPAAASSPSAGGATY